MKIALNAISEEKIQHTFFIDEQSFEKMLTEKPSSFSLQEASLECSLSKIGERVYISGNINAEFLVECSRCLTLTTAMASDTFTYVFIPVPERWENDVELSAEELDVVFYHGDIIDLTDIIIEQINLLVPLRILCRDDCKGLCPLCGKNRNEESCSCEASLGIGGFAGLKDFKIKSKS